MTAVQIALPAKLIDVFAGRADVRGAYGGRGSGKTRSFAKMAAVQGYRYGMQGTPGIILCARQYMNSLDDSSLEECKRAIEDEPFLASYYDVGGKYIKSRDSRINFTFAGLDRSIASVKSKGRILLCWVDEAEPVTNEAWSILIPTLREEASDWNAELWITWNPRRKNAAVERFRASGDPLIKITEVNWRDNPRFPALLERARQRDLADRPEEYDHIWEGAYATVIAGAYYAAGIVKAKSENRISALAIDPLMTIRLYADIGGTGARADSFVFIAAQFIGQTINVLNHYEVIGQPIGAHLEWLRGQGYTPERAEIWLPHDGDTQDRVFNISYASAFRKAGYKVTVVPNQGAGAAKARIEMGRRHFSKTWFDATKTTALVEALGWYHEKIHEERNIGLGPDHDWASHSADAAGLMWLTYDKAFTLSQKKPAEKPQVTSRGSWMAS